MDLLNVLTQVVYQLSPVVVASSYGFQVHPIYLTPTKEADVEERNSFLPQLNQVQSLSLSILFFSLKIASCHQVQSLSSLLFSSLLF